MLKRFWILTSITAMLATLACASLGCTAEMQKKMEEEINKAITETINEFKEQIWKEIQETWENSRKAASDWTRSQWKAFTDWLESLNPLRKPKDDFPEQPDIPDPPEMPRDPDIAYKFDYPIGDPDATGCRSGAGWYVSQDFADRKVFVAGPGEHLGEDWLKNSGEFAGEPVYALGRGKIIRSEANRSLGHVLMIRYDLPAGSDYPYVVSLYGHIYRVLPIDTWVDSNTIVGYIAPPGQNGFKKGTNEPWAVHLHFELRADSSRTKLADDSIHSSDNRIGYSIYRDGFLNPTDATSRRNPVGGGWINAHRTWSSENGWQPR